MATIVCVLVTLLSAVCVQGYYGYGGYGGPVAYGGYRHGGVSVINGISHVDGGYDVHFPQTEHYVVFEDNGKVTKIHVFSYVMDDQSTVGFSMLKKVHGHTMEMSLLDRYSLDPIDRKLYLADDLKMFMDHAKQAIPLEQHASTNVAFLASSDYWHASDKCWAILDEARSLLTDPEFTDFKVADPADIQVMSGEQQGAWSWVALNYDHISAYIKHDRHDHEHEPHHYVIPPSYGVMGLTQRSAFIAFLPDNGATSGTYTVTFGQTKFHLYAKSHVGFGTADVMSRLVEEHSVRSGAATFTNPCLLHGDEWKLTPFLNVTGTGEPAACLDLINNLLQVRNCPVDKCSIGDQYQPDLPKNMTFYATKDFTLPPLDITKAAGHYLDTVDVLVEGISYCHNETHFLNSPRESVLCLLSLYTPLLLHAFGDPGQNNKVIAASQVHMVDIEPALGMVVMDIYERSENIKEAEYGSYNPEAGDADVEGGQLPGDDDESGSEEGSENEDDSEDGHESENDEESENDYEFENDGTSENDTESENDEESENDYEFENDDKSENDTESGNGDEYEYDDDSEYDDEYEFENDDDYENEDESENGDEYGNDDYESPSADASENADEPENNEEPSEKSTTSTPTPKTSSTTTDDYDYDYESEDY